MELVSQRAYEQFPVLALVSQSRLPHQSSASGLNETMIIYLLAIASPT